jgi:hypothetical protein
MVAVFLGLVSSLFFAAATVAIHRGLLKMDYLSGLLVNLITNAIFSGSFSDSSSEPPTCGCRPT